MFKHLKKQIELYKTDPFLAGYYRSAYSSYSGFNTSASGGYGSTAGGSSSSKTDDYRSRHYGSFEDLHRSKAGSPGSGSPHSSPSRDGGSGTGTSGTGGPYDYDSKGPGHSNLGRAGSFRQEWERRRQQKRQNAGGILVKLFFINLFLCTRFFFYTNSVILFIYIRFSLRISAEIISKLININSDSVFSGFFPNFSLHLMFDLNPLSTEKCLPIF